MNSFFGGHPGDELVLSTGPGPIEFQGDPQPALEIRVGEREPSIFYNKPVVPTLLGLADDVTVIIGKIEGIAP
jgi:hypothetical protein